MKTLLINIFGTATIKGFISEYGWWPILFSLIVVWPIVGFLPSIPQPVFYSTLGCCAVWSAFRSKRYCIPVLCLLCYLPFEILLSGAPSFFSPWMRFVLFAFVLMSTSPLFESDKLIDFRQKVFRLIVIWCVLLSVGSFVARFAGVNYMRTFWVSEITKAGTFGGLTNHSMMLGPVSGFSFLYLMYKYFISKRQLLLIPAVMSIGSVMFSASRSALIATLGGLVVLIYFLNKYSKKIMKYVLLLSFVGIVSFPYWSDTLINGAMSKNEGSFLELSTSSRDVKWDNRIDEFKSSPIFGIGFCCVDRNHFGDYAYDGGIETGSSWLSVLSMTGIIGAVIMLWILVKTFSKLYRSRMTERALLGAFVMLFIINMLAEGYIFAGGNFLCILFWLTLGQIFALGFNLNNNTVKRK